MRSTAILARRSLIGTTLLLALSILCAPPAEADLQGETVGNPIWITSPPFVVDGYTGDCGDYHLRVEEYPVCHVECPPDAIPEGEEDCGYGYVDEFNGGCGSHPPAFSILEPSEEPIVVCGTTGTWQDYPIINRDTDWYEIQLEETATITFRSLSEWNHQICIVDGREGCFGFEVLECDDALPCFEAEIIRTLEPGTYWLWVGAPVEGGVPCGSEYVMTVEGYTPSGTSSAGPDPSGQDPSGSDPMDGRSGRTAVDLRVNLSAGPNPFGGATTLHLWLGRPAAVHLTIHDVSGRLVRTVRSGELPAGEHGLAWDGRDDSGRSVGAGLFYARLQADGSGMTLPLMRVR